jgi:hypothetical protein
VTAAFDRPDVCAVAAYVEDADGITAVRLFEDGEWGGVRLEDLPS